MSYRPTRPLRWIAAASVSLAAIGCGVFATPIAPVAPGGGTAGRVENLSVAGRRTVQTGDTLIKFHFTNKAELQRWIDAGMDAWMVKDGYAAGTVPAGLLREMETAGARLEMITPRGYSIRSSFDPGYHTYEELVPALRALAGKHPDICRLMDIGDSWEKTQGKANRDLWMLHISGKQAKNQKPGIVFFGNHHARELVTVEVPLRLAQLLLDGYGKDATITDLVDSRDIYILPMVNPDGHIQAEKGQSWRKNTNGIKLQGNPLEWGGYPGTDLNRNYGYFWGKGGSSSNPKDQTYMGKTAFSEPETQAIKAFFERHKNIKVMMSYHSFSDLILWPWGYTKAPTPDAQKLSTVGRKLASFNGYEPKQAVDLYVTSGTTDDWTYGQFRMLSFTTEIGDWNDNFDPPFAKVGEFFEENRPGALYLIKLAGESDGAFGPEVRVQGDKVVFSGNKVTPDAVAVEMHVGRLGAPGTGQPVELAVRGPVSLDRLPMPRTPGRVWLRAKDTQGNWGPATAVRL